MSELKKIYAEDTFDEDYMEYHHSDKRYYREVYLKSNADKVIADLEESHKKEVGQLLIEIAELKDKVSQYKVLYKEICRDINTQERFFALQIAKHKYKRCLAMARWCRECSWSKCVEKVDFYYKWYNRWMELADQFKEP